MRESKLVSYLKKYNCQNLNYLLTQSTVGGGYEAWFQVEIACFLELTLPKNYVIYREKGYNKYSINPDLRERCDLLIEDEKEISFIEFKCFNPNHTRESLVTDFLNDVDKLYNLSPFIMSRTKIVDLTSIVIFWGTPEQVESYFDKTNFTIVQLLKNGIEGIYAVLFTLVYNSKTQSYMKRSSL